MPMWLVRAIYFRSTWAYNVLTPLTTSAAHFSSIQSIEGFLAFLLLRNATTTISPLSILRRHKTLLLQDYYFRHDKLLLLRHHG